MFVSDYGLLGEDGQAAMRSLKKARETVVDRKFTRLLRQIEEMYSKAEAEAVPPGRTSPFEYAARMFEENLPANELRVRISEAITRATKLDRRRAGSY